MIIVNNNNAVNKKIILINLEDLKGHGALELLEKYDGINPYLKGMRNDYLKNKKIKLTEVQTKYIVDNHEREPQLINRLIGITEYLGLELQSTHDLKFVPLKIKVEYMLAETDKTYHVYGKITQKQLESKMYWLPKTQVLDDPYFEVIDVDVDFEKYNKILAEKEKTLYAHQMSGVKFLVARNGAILADDMGLGKSMQSIIAALEVGAQNILVVCPANVKINWQREINMFCPSTVLVDGSKWRQAKFTIINFDILKNYHTLDSVIKKSTPEDPVKIKRDLVNGKFDLVIVDEAHNLKNNSSIRGEIMVELAVKYGIEKIWLLTGTPVANRPMDFFNLLKLIKSPLADNWKHFATRYCDGRQITQHLKNGNKKKIWLTSGASNLEELAAKTKNLILRRLKKDVLDMPEKIITPMYYDLTESQWTEYNNLWEEYLIKRKELKKRGKVNKELTELIMLRKFVAMQAIPKTITLAEEAIEQGRKVIIFTNFTEELEVLQEHFDKICVIHNGAMSIKDKQKSVDRFQETAKIKVFIGNEKSAGVGITLTEATVVIFNSYDWVTGNNEQAEDRSYRIGQKNDVNIYYQLFIDTISIRMWETLKFKKSIINTILSEKSDDFDETEWLMEKLILDEES